MARTGNVGIAIAGVGTFLPAFGYEDAPSWSSPDLPDDMADERRLTWGYFCSDADATASIPDRRFRRLGRSQKWAMVAARRALDDAGAVAVAPERMAVMAGTGLGALGETADFLLNLVERNESEPKPARFINSVHSSVASQLGIAFGFRGENSTFSQQAISFELALWQAVRILVAGRADGVLVCGVDEMSPYVVAAGRCRGWWRREAGLPSDGGPMTPMAKVASTTVGTLPGEGAASFLLRRADDLPRAERRPRLATVRVGPVPQREIIRLDPVREVGFIEESMAAAELSVRDVDFFLFGANGDARSAAAYAAVAQALSQQVGRDIAFGTYKQLCGEYCTAPAVGLAVAANIIRDGGRVCGAAPSTTLSAALSDVERAAGSPSATSSGPSGSGPSGASMPHPLARIAVYHLSDSGYHSLCLVTA